MAIITRYFPLYNRNVKEIHCSHSKTAIGLLFKIKIVINIKNAQNQKIAKLFTFHSFCTYKIHLPISVLYNAVYAFAHNPWSVFNIFQHLLRNFHIDWLIKRNKFQESKLYIILAYKITKIIGSLKQYFLGFIKKNLWYNNMF